MIRDSKGRYVNGTYNESYEEKLKRISSFKESWKKRSDYILNIKDEKFYNIWRSFRFTKKGKSIGCSDEWKTYKGFYETMYSTWEKGKRLIRLNINDEFSKENCIWASDEEVANIKNNCIKLEYNGEIKTLKEWAYTYNRSIAGIRNRYHKNKNLTSEEIIFGVKKKPKRKIISACDLSKQQVRNKASKMLSSYKAKDYKKGFLFDLDVDWMIENILYKPCIYCGSLEKIGCDRIDNLKGHSKDNVVPCCVDCNTVRNNIFSFEEMLVLGKEIKRIKDLRG